MIPLTFSTCGYGYGGWGGDACGFLYVEFVVCLVLAGKGKLTFLRLCFWVLGPLKVWSQLQIEMLSEGFRGEDLVGCGENSRGRFLTSIGWN